MNSSVKINDNEITSNIFDIISIKRLLGELIEIRICWEMVVKYLFYILMYIKTRWTKT